jgi:hypothetical protein
MHRRIWGAGLIVFGLLFATIARGEEDRCAVCGAAFKYTEPIYTVLDKVTHKKVFVCQACLTSPDECCICGLPVKNDYLKLADGRCICSRDRQTAVLDRDDAERTCFDAIDSLNRVFSRFTAFPTTNVVFALADRVDLYDQYVVVGDNFEAPNILGFMHSGTNAAGLEHFVRLMIGLPRAEFRATCAHEFAHAWVFENVPPARLKTLNRDAHEGFCELIAYLLMDSLHEGEQKKIILQNAYTRGQVDLFIAAEKRYGINDVLDWVRWGASSKLRAENLEDIRNVEMPRFGSVGTNTFIIAAKRATAPDRLLLKGISSTKDHPLALINDQTLAVGETAKVHVGTSNVIVRCIAVGNRSAKIQLVDSGRELELQLPPEK